MTSSLCFGRLIKPSTPNCFSWLKTEVQVSTVLDHMHSFPLRTKWKLKFHLQPLQNGCGRWFSYQLQWPEKVFINTNNKNNTLPFPLNAPHSCCGAPMASAGQRWCTSENLDTWTLRSSVLGPLMARKDGCKCPVGKMKMTFCLDATTHRGEYMTPRRLDAFLYQNSLHLTKSS